MRSEVMWFGNQMEKKLRKRAYKGDGGTWLTSSIRYLLNRLLDESIELIHSCRAGAYHTAHGISSAGDLDCVIDECVDVANFAMMIADRMKHVQEADQVLVIR